MIRKFDTFGDLLRGALGENAVAAADLLDLFTPDVVFEFPFAPEGFPTKLEGRNALSAHLARLGPLIAFDAFHLEAAHICGETVVLEFTCDGRGVETGIAYDQAYVSVIALRGGRIARYRDYWNPLVAIAALGGAQGSGSTAWPEPGA